MRRIKPALRAAAPALLPDEVLDDQLVHDLAARGELTPLVGEAPVDKAAVMRLRKAVALRAQRRQHRRVAR